MSKRDDRVSLVDMLIYAKEAAALSGQKKKVYGGAETVAPRWQPLTTEEEAQLLEEGRRIARSWGDHYGDLV